MTATGRRAAGRAAWEFVGRDRELAELVAGLEDALAGQGRLFLIAGEPGIGKTGLAEALGRYAVERGARVVWGRCWEGGGAPPFWPWVQIVRELAEAWDDSTLAARLGAGGRYVAELSPDLAERLGAEPAAAVASIASDSARFYLFEAISRFLVRTAAEEPLLLIIDDLHAADDPSLLLLKYLARNLRASRVMVVGTYRDADVGRVPGLADALGELVREGQLTTLRGLSHADVGSLIGDLTGAAPSDGVSLAVHETTEGNPLFVREAVRLLASSGQLDQPGRPGVPIPGSVRALIQQRLAPLSVGAVQALSVGAVVGREFDLAIVGAAADMPAERLLDAVAEAEALGVLVEEGTTPGRYRFSHALMREVTYEALPITVRVGLHRAVGEAIEQVYGADSDSHLAELSRHFAEAASAGESARALTYSRRAGDRALRAHAYEEAAAEYQRALHALDLAGPGADDALRCEVLLSLGTAQVRAGRYAEAKAIHLQAAEIARRIASADLLARAALGFGEPHVEGGHVNRELVALLREALEAAPPDDSPLRARLLARLSVELTFSDEVHLTDALSREAVELARRLGDARALGDALDARWMAVWGPDGLQERASLADEALSLSQQTGDRDLELRGRLQRVATTLEAGDFLAVEADIAAYARLADDLKMPVHQWILGTMRAMRALLLGSFEEAERLAGEAFAAQPERPSARWAQMMELTMVRWEQRRLGELHAVWTTQVERFPRLAIARAWLALADIERGDTESARRALQILAERLPGLARTGLWLPGIALASLVAARLDDHDAAERLYPALLPFAGQMVAMNMEQPVACFGAVSFHLGLLATAAARWAEAERHFEAALGEHERMGAAPLLARTRYEYARMLLRRDEPGDLTRARVVLARAEATAQSLGLVGLSHEIAALPSPDASQEAPERPTSGGAAVAAAPEPATEPVAQVTPATPAPSRDRFQQEGELWTVSFDGTLVHLKDSKGLRQLAHLLSQPGRELHVTDLEALVNAPVEPSRPGRAGGVGHGELELRADTGDAGEMLDGEARAAYKARLDDLQEEIDEAEDLNDSERAERAREEREFLIRELARAVGLGGRDRKAASHAERARLNATRAIRSAMASIGKAHPSLGRHLEATVRTGRYCSYTPDPRSLVDWVL